MANNEPIGSAAWPALPLLADWQDTLETLHMWTQIVGKIRLELSPWLNHSWGSALYVTTRGLTTSPIPYEGRTFALRPMSVADFYRKTMGSG